MRNLIFIANCISNEEAIIIEHIGLALQTTDNFAEKSLKLLYQRRPIRIIIPQSILFIGKLVYQLHFN